MGRRGPPPTPTATLKLRGSWRAKEREKDGGEPTPDRGHPVEPKNLSEEEQAVWNELCEMIDLMGLLFVVDGWQLERYATFFMRWRKVEAAIRLLATKPEQFVLLYAKDDKRGMIRGLAAESRSLDQQLKQIENSFGLNPSARTRIRLMDRLGDAAKTETDSKSKKRFFRA